MKKYELNDKVYHKKYGEGYVKSKHRGFIIVQFEELCKKFKIKNSVLRKVKS